MPLPGGSSKTEIRERFGNPTGSGTTSLGRQTETYRIQTPSQNPGIGPDERAKAWFAALTPNPLTFGAWLALIVDAIARAPDISDIAFIYGEDHGVLYYYDTKADPAFRYGQALSSMTHPLDNIEDAKCPKLKVCVERHIEETRKRAEEVGYTLTQDDEKALQTGLEIATDTDDGKVTKEEAFRLRLHCNIGTRPATEYGEQRKISLDLHNALHKLTDRLFNEIAEGHDSSVRHAVAGYIEVFRNLMAGFDHTLNCADEVTFQLEIGIAKDADEGKLTREEALSKLRTITMRHLTYLYFGRS